MKITKRMMEKASAAAWDYLDERVPQAAMPGGVQLFADPGDHLDAAMKHEAGCEELARRILTAALTRANPIRK